jgi:hypothetical protein
MVNRYFPGARRPETFAGLPVQMVVFAVGQLSALPTNH